MNECSEKMDIAKLCQNLADKENGEVKKPKKYIRVCKIVFGFFVSYIVLCEALQYIIMPAKPSYQFDDYEFGTTMNDISKQLISRNKTIRDEEFYLWYKDSILDSECTITFNFTPKDSLLYATVITWEENKFRGALNALSSKYSKYNVTDIKVDVKCVWQEDHNAVALNFCEETGETTLTYLNFTLRDKANTEKKELSTSRL